MPKYTKIVATLSDWNCEPDFVRSLFENGMNVVRMNSAHLTKEGVLRMIHNIRSVSNEIALLMDTKGPEIRTTAIENNAKISFQAGDRVRIIGDSTLLTTKEQIALSYPGFAEEVPIGTHIMFDDGELEFVATEREGDALVCTVLNSGDMGSRKSVNVPGVRINLPSLTDRDRENIELAIQHNIDFIAHSFVRNRQDVLDIQKILDEHHSHIKIIAKIENQEGVDNIDEILEVAYGIMVARGDLGIEIAQEKIPGIQRILIRKAAQARRPVIVATQMLHTMIHNPRPTRAEVTDVANAIYYRTDAIMLSGETAYGKYPIEAVKTMSRIAEESEKTKLPENDILIPFEGNDPDITPFLAKQAVEACNAVNVKAIINESSSGRSARFLAAYRGKVPVYTICYHTHTVRELALSYGVFPIFQEGKENSRDYFISALTRLVNNGLIEKDSVIAHLSGDFDERGKTSLLEINRVDRILKYASEHPTK